MLGLSGEPLSDKIDERLSGVGMIRSEYLCRACKEYITTERCRKFIREYVSNICKIYYPAEVWYRTTEFLSSEINTLKGVDTIINEKHCYLGLRGTRRGLKYPDTFQLELENLAKVAQEYDNLNVLFPFIYDSSELVKAKKLLKKVKFPGKYGIMAEIPATILMLDKFCEQGISNITIGVNDLTSLTLGMERGQYADHSHPSVIKLITLANSIGKKYNIPVSVAGYVTKKLESICVSLEIDSFIVHYNALPEILDISAKHLKYLHFSKELRDKYV
mgnify:FL=1